MRYVIRIEISPAAEHTRDFTIEDWRQLWHDFVREYDSIEFKDKDGNIYSHKTNIAGSISTVWLHFESDSGIPHLHAAICRKDCDGRTNNDHNIHLRAQYAAERVAEKRGWTTARNIRMAKASEIADDLTGILRAMPSWSWEDYVARVRANGYTLMERHDRNGRMCGYTVGDGNKVYRASELGKGSKLMASKIETTWTALLKYYNGLRVNGTKWITAERLTDRIKSFSFVGKNDNVIGLQVADLIAYPLSRQILNPDRPNPAFQIIAKNIYSYKGARLGLKIIPH